MPVLPDLTVSRMPSNAPSAAAAIPAHKRFLDLMVIALLIPFALPLFAVIALCIRLDSAGPVLFRQTRIGRDGRPFTMLKFRSMHENAEGLRGALVARSDRPGTCFKMARDPRITRFGRVLRRTSLDEVPQLLNVLAGDMSLVGPRPGLPEEVRAYSARDRRRLRALPGISGPWQVSGRADLSFEEMIALDLDYIARASLRTDLAILWRTLAAVIGGRGAY